MPISPSDLPWWGWLLCSFSAAIVAMFAGGFASASFDDTGKAGRGCVSMLIAIPAGLAALSMGVMGVILFVKWVWNS